MDSLLRAGILLTLFSPLLAKELGEGKGKVISEVTCFISILLALRLLISFIFAACFDATGHVFDVKVFTCRRVI
jgi:hypothetical protein